MGAEEVVAAEAEHVEAFGANGVKRGDLVRVIRVRDRVGDVQEQRRRVVLEMPKRSKPVWVSISSERVFVSVPPTHAELTFSPEDIAALVQRLEVELARLVASLLTGDGAPNTCCSTAAAARSNVPSA